MADPDCCAIDVESFTELLDRTVEVPAPVLLAAAPGCRRCRCVGQACRGIGLACC